jgi:hypothetical protein
MRRWPKAMCFVQKAGRRSSKPEKAKVALLRLLMVYVDLIG